MEPDKPNVPPPEVPDDQKDYEAASQSTADFVKNIGPVKEARRKRRIRRVVLMIAGGLLILGGGGYGAYRFLTRPDEPKAPSQTEQSEQKPQNKKASQTALNSSTLQLSLKYPNNWAVDESVSTEISLTSPITELSAADNQTVDAKVVITIRKKDGLLPGFTGESASAVIESQKFAYTSPAPGQRAQTYLSFLSFGDAKLVEAMYITGDKAYLADAAVPKADILLVDPTVKVQFYPCKDQTCSVADVEPIGIAPDAWGNDETLQAAFEILKSLAIQ